MSLDYQYSSTFVRHSSDNFDNALFLVNKSGFPVDSITWERMFSFAMKHNPHDSGRIENLRNSLESHDDVPFPTPPRNFQQNLSISEKVLNIQNYLKQLEYNHTGTQFFDVRKYRSLSGLCEFAKSMIQKSLPIKCLEAVILSIYLTQDILDLERFTIGFKSISNGASYQHVVLGLWWSGGGFGALGMSRREDLMDKPLEFKTLSSLIKDYVNSYRRYLHSLTRVKIGLPISHDSHSCESIPWLGLKIILQQNGNTDDDIWTSVDKFSKMIKTNYLNMGQTSSTNLAHRREFSLSPVRRKSTCLKSKPPSHRKPPVLPIVTLPNSANGPVLRV